MIVHFDRDITVDQLRAALAALEVDLLPGEGGEYRARRRDRFCAHCDMPAAADLQQRERLRAPLAGVGQAMKQGHTSWPDDATERTRQL